MTERNEKGVVGWKKPGVAQQQHDLAIGEWEKYKRGEYPNHNPFNSFIEFVELEKPTSILELGCGAGYYSLVARSAHPALDRFVGADYSQEMITHAQAHYPDEGWYTADVRMTLPFKDEQFDMVVLSSVLLHLPEQEQWVFALREAARVAKGSVFVARTSMHLPRSVDYTRKFYGTEIYERHISSLDYELALDAAELTMVRRCSWGSDGTNESWSDLCHKQS